MRRWHWTAMVAVLAAGALAAPAQALDVDVVANRLSLTDSLLTGSGEPNVLTVGFDDATGEFLVEDLVGIRTVGVCARESATRARCPSGGVNSILATLGPLNDAARLFLTRVPEGAEQRVLGGAGNDLILGSNAGDSLSGGNGNDKLKGRGGDDILRGGKDVDSCSGGLGTDRASACERVRSVP